MFRGSYDEAAPHLERARELAQTDLARAQAEWRIGELVFRRGDVMGSVPIFERALHLLGCRRPSNALALALMTLRELAVQVVHTLFPRRFLARRRVEDGQRDLLEARIYGRLGYCTYMGRGLLWTVPEQLRQLNLAERYPATPELAQACMTHAVLVQMERAGEAPDDRVQDAVGVDSPVGLEQGCDPRFRSEPRQRGRGGE